MTTLAQKYKRLDEKYKGREMYEMTQNDISYISWPLYFSFSFFIFLGQFGHTPQAFLYFLRNVKFDQFLKLQILYISWFLYFFQHFLDIFWNWPKWRFRWPVKPPILYFLYVYMTFCIFLNIFYIFFVSCQHGYIDDFDTSNIHPNLSSKCNNIGVTKSVPRTHHC